jgi:hypothetical protein
MILRWFPKRPDHPLADGQELKRILAELHVDRALNAVDEVTGWFESLKHAEDFRLDHYFDVLRQLDEAAQQHLRRLARDYLHSPHLSTLERQRLWTRSCTYLCEVVTAYSLCLERARRDPKSRGSVAFKVSLPLLNARLQAACCARLKWLAYRYELADEELWRCLGETYLAAEAAGHAQKSLQLYPAQLGLSSVAQQYLHALVFFTSSVDGLMPLQVELADRLIAHFLPGFVFSADCRPDSVYWVDAASGAAPARLTRKPRESGPGLRFFSAGPALTALEELIHVVERGEVPTTLNLGGEYSPKALLPVLRHLRLYWALRPPQRRHQRHAVKTGIAVLQGFEHSYVVFSGAVPRLTREAGVQSAMLEDVSLGGFRACFDDAGGERIKLGALLCMQAEGGDNWLLGAARRINRLRSARAKLGVQVLSRQAQSIELRPRRSGFAAAVAIPGIWLRDGGEPDVLRIVLPLGSFDVRETLDFCDADRLHVLTALELEESGNDYEIARFHEQSAT